MKKPVIRIISNLPRSGGTLLGRCIGCMNGITLLSEIHPNGSTFYNPLDQAREWYGMLDASEARGAASFGEAISLIHARTAERGSSLVIRDWAHLDYIGYPFLENPPFRSLLAEALSARFHVLETALIRHPADVWISLNKLPAMQGLPLDTFLRGYHNYVSQRINSSFIRYEDFTRNPDITMRTLCNMLELPFDSTFSEKWQDYDKVTGAVHGKARGSRLTCISPLPHHDIPEELRAALEGNDDYHASLSLLDYEIQQ